MSKLSLCRFAASLFLLAGFLIATPAHAGSATWNLNPTTNSWTTAGNWTPATVPNGPTDVATLDATNTPEISLAAPTSTPLTLTLDSLVFGPNAPFYTIDVSNGLSSTQLLFVGAGVVNNGVPFQMFNVTGGAGVVFSNSATMSAAVGFTVNGSTPTNPATSSLTLKDNVTIADYNEIDAFGSASGAAGNAGALVTFLDQTDAGYCSVIGYGGQVAGAAGATVVFDGSANVNMGAAAAFGGEVAGAFGATVTFQGDATLGDGFAGCEPGSAGGGPGYLFFKGGSTGGTGTYVIASGVVDISQHDPPGLTVGVLAGLGTIYLGSNNLTSGFLNTSSTFAGTIKDGGAGGGTGGSMTFSNNGGVSLQGASTYTGGTIIDRGTVVTLDTATGSALGTGPVQILNGELAGTGAVSNTVVVGTGSGPGAQLSPTSSGAPPLASARTSCLMRTRPTLPISAPSPGSLPRPRLAGSASRVAPPWMRSWHRDRAPCLRGSSTPSWKIPRRSRRSARLRICPMAAPSSWAAGRCRRTTKAAMGTTSRSRCSEAGMTG